MTPAVDWSADAENDLRELYHFIAVERQARHAAVGLIDSIRQKAKSYARQPGMGTLHEEFPSDEVAGPVRSFHVKHWIAFYYQTPAGIYILRVIDGRRDYGGLL